VHAGGWGATLISELVLRGVALSQVASVSMPDDLLVAYSPTLEDAIIPSVETIVSRIRELA
jgi:hypothetical protein